jgi:FKBP-type peptidyl-prolyl cis-trans isomerase FkpA
MPYDGSMSMRASICLLLLLSSVAACGGDDSPTSPSPSTGSAPFATTDLRVGTGAEATAGRNVTVNFTGWLYSATAVENKGTQFDTGSFPFTIGGNVIQGFSLGVTGMRVGGLRRIVIPPELGYGAAGRPPQIPPNATLVFDVELLSVQ